MTRDTGSPTYQSFLLRCWCVSPAAGGDPARWRFVLRDVAAEPRERSFGTLQELNAYLLNELNAVTRSSTDPAQAEG